MECLVESLHVWRMTKSNSQIEIEIVKSLPVGKMTKIIPSFKINFVESLPVWRMTNISISFPLRKVNNKTRRVEVSCMRPHSNNGEKTESRTGQSIVLITMHPRIPTMMRELRLRRVRVSYHATHNSTMREDK
jgi:hypothetical protein